MTKELSLFATVADILANGRKCDYFDRGFTNEGLCFIFFIIGAEKIAAAGDIDVAGNE